MQGHLTRWCVIGSLLVSPNLVGASPLKPNPAEPESWSESVTAIADLEDGGYIELQAIFTNAGIGDERAACRMVVVRAGQPPRSAAAKVDRSRWRFDSNDERLDLGICSLRNTPEGLDVRAQMDTMHVAMNFERRARKLVMPDSDLTDGKTFYQYHVYVPWSRVTTRIQVGKGESELGTGRGFVDHTRSTAMPKDIWQRWIRILVLPESGRGTLVRLRYPPGDAAPRGWHWPLGRRRATLVQSAEVSGLDQVPPLGSGFDFRVKIRNQEYDIHVSKLLYRYAPTEEFGIIGKLVESFVGRPVTKSYRATVKDLKTGLLSQALLEIATNIE